MITGAIANGRVFKRAPRIQIDIFMSAILGLRAGFSFQAFPFFGESHVDRPASRSGVEFRHGMFGVGLDHIPGHALPSHACKIRVAWFIFVYPKYIFYLP